MSDDFEQSVKEWSKNKRERNVRNLVSKRYFEVNGSYLERNVSISAEIFGSSFIE